MTTKQLSIRDLTRHALSDPDLIEGGTVFDISHPSRAEYDRSWRSLRDSALETVHFIMGEDHEGTNRAQRDCLMFVNIATTFWVIAWYKSFD